VHQWRTALAGAGAALPAEIGNALDEVSAGTATIGQDGKGAAFAAG
jgi:hypothetical protein